MYKTSEFYTAELLYFYGDGGLIIFACIMGGGDFNGIDDVVDAGTETTDNDPVAMYLSYRGVWNLDTLGVYVVRLVDHLLL